MTLYSRFFFLQSRKTLKTRMINILKKFDTHMVYMLNSNQERKMKKTRENKNYQGRNRHESFPTPKAQI